MLSISPGQSPRARAPVDELLEQPLCNWYVPAKEALELGLVAGIVDGAGNLA